MSIYPKSVRLLLKDFVASEKIVRGQIFSKEQVVSWFRTNFPKIKLGTITAHLLRMSVNSPTRVHYSVHSNGDDDLLFKIDGSHFRLYEAEKDPAPIYIPSPSGVTGNPEGEDTEIEDEVTQPTGFAYESDLRDFLARNLYIIEPGLRLYEDEGISGIEFPVGGRFIDILAMDKQNNYVVIELKVSKGYDRVIGQLLRYMAWIEENQAEFDQKVRGVIIAREISGDLRLATSKLSDVELFEYELSVALKRITKERNAHQTIGQPME